MKTNFIEALEQYDIEGIKRIPKGDLHNHAPRGGNVRFIEKWAGVQIPRLNRKFLDLDDMQSWYKKNVRCHCQGIDGYEIRIKGAFKQAKDDGVTKLVLSFGLGEETIYGSLSNFVKVISRIHKDVAPEIEFIPELSLDRGTNVDSILHLCAEYFNMNFYRSIDICGNEFAQPIANFKPLYRLAKSYGLKLRAHAGEFGDADSVREAVEELELDEVQHGIAVAKCKNTTRWLAENNITLNICPASNIILSRSQDYKTHPIRTLFDSGVRVTINTDDILIFDVSISRMFLDFYKDNIFTVYELNEIRQNGLM
ncbi:adenosine deaminase [Proteiniborus sp. MB09-C3]|uniref:adenosine deaminase n=1 Tax=Proteiniborus sp. MB09-C3 TaxID=3050072 RepID=UPI002553EB7A|nr:adenosine deaminase [Proteiniborus sp. MB09-C3]WIV12723.1 adenosine deaminase [Proteiniborus sp. MB09-C3]